MHIPLRRRLNTRSDQTDAHPVAVVEPGLDSGTELGLEPPSGGLMGSRELQGGGRMLIIKRPHVAKFMFI